jgi:hypothetical protein
MLSSLARASTLFLTQKKDSRRSIVVVHDSILGQGFDGGGVVIRIRDA